MLQEGNTTPHSLLRRTIFLALVLACIISISNFSLLIYIKSTLRDEGDGIVTIITDSCTRTESTLLISTLLINICSTLLFVASNNCAQYLISPTRDEVSRAHCRGEWVAIGVPSLRNLRHINRTRLIVWIIMLLSSVPLHLLWNSVLFSTLSANDYMAALVTQDFLKGKTFNKTSMAIDEVILEKLTALQDEASNHKLRNFTNADCIEAYISDRYESQWRNLLVVTTNNVSKWHGDDVLQTWQHHPDENSNIDQLWPCNGNESYLGGSKPVPCTLKELLYNAESWAITNLSSNEIAPVQYCLVEASSPSCTVRVSTTLLTIVVVFNFIKVLCFLATLYLTPVEPLITIGDAISSFLSRPDYATENHGVISRLDWFAPEGRRRVSVRGGLANTDDKIELGPNTQPFRCSTPYWFSSSSRTRWRVGSIMICLGWLMCLAIFMHSTPGSFRQIFDMGIGFTQSSPSIAAFSFHSVASYVTVINTPQLLVSVLYLFYNNLLTAMLLTAETLDYALPNGRKALRTSFPLPGQRAAYYLQLPLRWSIPLMISISSLHYFLSRSMFYITVDIFDINGRFRANISADGWSPAAVLITLAISAVMIIVLFGLGFRQYEARMPLLGSNSFAIAAACHPSAEEFEPMTKKIAYGVFVDHLQRRRAGFTSLEVEELQNGVIY